MLGPIEEIFCEIDDFFKEIMNELEQKMLRNSERKRRRECRLCLSEIGTIMVLFHMSQYRTFKDYYHECVIKTMRGYFPSLVSYNRFVELQKQVVPYLMLFLQQHRGEETGMYYVDATKLPVCHNKRIPSHKTFEGIAERGKTTTGWFFGFKLHLVINQKGEIMSFNLSPGNLDDRKALEKLFKNLQGLGFGDAGYVGKNWQEMLKNMGIKFITTVKKNMKKPSLLQLEKLLLRKRGLIETVIDQLKNICHIDHTRHRSPDNFLANLVSGLTAYFFKPRKPSIDTSQITSRLRLTSN